VICEVVPDHHEFTMCDNTPQQAMQSIEKLGLFLLSTNITTPYPQALVLASDSIM